MRFISRYSTEGDTISAEEVPEGDDVGKFIARIEKTDRAFQRQLVRESSRYYDMVKDFLKAAEKA